MKLKNFQVCWCPTDWQLADMFTKSLSVKKFEAMDLYIRGYADRPFEQQCQLIEPGVWSSTLLDMSNKDMCSNCQVNTVHNLVAALRDVKAEGECKFSSLTAWCGWPWVYTPDEGSVKVSGGGHRQGWEHGVVSENHEVVTNAHHP